MLKKQIFITNGMARCGKDTFAVMLNDIVPTLKYSSIDEVKRIAKECGWDGRKEEKDRKFLSDLKFLTTKYNDMPFKAIKSKIREFNSDDIHTVLLIDIREPEEIEKAKNAFGAKTIIIKNDRVKQINSNLSDADVYNYSYDIEIDNNGTLDDFKHNIETFAERYHLYA